MVVPEILFTIGFLGASFAATAPASCASQAEKAGKPRATRLGRKARWALGFLLTSGLVVAALAAWRVGPFPHPCGCAPPPVTIMLERQRALEAQARVQLESAQSRAAFD